MQVPRRTNTINFKGSLPFLLLNILQLNDLYGLFLLILLFLLPPIGNLRILRNLDNILFIPSINLFLLVGEVDFPGLVQGILLVELIENVIFFFKH